MSTAFPTDMLDYLVCPETHQTLRLADDALLARLRAAQQAGKLQNKSGAPVAGAIEQALVREDNLIAYLVNDGIPVMLIEEGVELGQLG